MGLYIDIGVCVVALIIVIIMLSKGLTNSLCGVMKIIGCLVLAIALTSVVVDALSKIALVTDLSALLASKLAPLFEKVSGATTVVSSLEELQTVMSSGPLALMASQAETLWTNMSLQGTFSIADYYSVKLFYILLNSIVFFILYIVSIYTVKLIKLLLNLLNKVSFFKFCDKVLGALFGIAMAYAILILLLTAAEIVVVMFMPTYTDIVMNLLSGSTILTWLHNGNIVGALISSMFDITLPVIPVIS